ncbi:Hypothetical protein, putative [Bodo saltans]|uniref:B30.2/SPRY domain-containing protein n=1 Tax=Bodo saltans TaxID=75058 RepID=A0A0S4INW6_BODSA|nr:Hypothetical protein, putative [Bodo saltans]|eukprot:CUE95151.1 Hypothetical protein, putative [Bodo saltans]
MASRYDLASVPDGLLDPTSQRLHVRSTAQAMVAAAVGGQFPPHLLSRAGSGGGALANELAILTSTLPGSMVGGYGSAGQSSSSTEASSYASFLRAMGPAPSSSTSSRYPQYGSTLLPTAASTTPNGISRAGLRVPMVVILLDKEAGLNVPVPSLEQPHSRQSASAAAAASRRVVGDVASDDSSLDDDDIHARGDNNDHSNMFPLKPWPPVGGASPRAATTLASSSSSSPTGRSHPYHNVPSSAGITFGLAMYVHDTVSHAELGEPFSIPQQWEKHKCTSVFRRLIALVNGAGQPVLSIDFVNDRLVANIRTSTSSTTSDGEQATHVSLPLLPLSTADCVDRWTTLTFCLTHHEILGYRDGELVAALSLDEAEVPWLRSGEGDVVAVGSDDDDDGGSKIVSITVGQWAPLLSANNQQDTSIEECANHDKTPISVKNVRLWSTALPKHILRNSYDAAIALGLDSAHGYAKPVLSFLCNEGTGDCVKSDDGRWSMALIGEGAVWAPQLPFSSSTSTSGPMALIGEGAVWAPQLPFSSSTSTTMTLELDIEQSRAAQQPHTADGVHPLPGCDSSATLAANLSLPSADERDGHWASLPKQHDPDDVLLDFLVPRKELLAHYSALETSHLHVVTHTLMSSLIAHDARRCVLNTIATIMSARNDLYLATPHAIEQFQMLRLDSNNGGCGCGLEVGGGSDVNNAHTLNAIVQCENTVTMASNLVRYNNGPYIPRNQILTITRFCNAMLTTSLKQVQLLPDLQQDILRSFMSDALDTISSSSTSSSHGNSGLSSDQTEVFDVEIFYTALGANADCQLHPFSVMNGGNGWISFEVPRGMENLFLFADKQQKNSMAKFPDAQGSWPDTELSVAAAAAAAAAIAAATTSASSTSPFPSALWCYAKPNASMKASPARFRVRVPSHRPTVGHLCLQLLCEISLKQSTQQLTLTTTTTSPTTPLPSAPLPPVLFDARVLSLFAALIRDHRGDRRIACLVTFTHILLLIREHAACVSKASAPFPIHDRCPLHILLDRFNTFHFQTERRNASHPASVFMMSGAAVFPPVSRRVAELLATAVQVNAEWRGGEQHQTARDVMHSTWNRLLELQRAAAVLTPTSDATPPPAVSQGLAVGLSRVTLGASLAPSIQHASSSSVTWRKRSRGVWFVSCDRAWQTARSNVGLTRGRWYFEARLPPNGSHISVGLVSNAFQGVVEATSSTLGHCGSSWGFDGSRNSRWHNGIRNEFSSNPRIKWKGRDVIGLLMDLESGTLSCTHNGKPVSIGYDNVFVGSVNTCFYPAVSFTSSGCDVNFGGAPFVYDLPLGYLPVDVNLFMHPRAGILPLAAAIATIEIAEWSTKEKKMNPPLPFLLQSCDDAQSQHSSADVNLHQQQSRQGSAEVSFIQVSDRKKRCFDCEMRTGESAACLVRGTAVITLPSSSSSTMSPSSQGRWYFEIGIHGEGAVQLGWAAAPFNQRSIGEDALSWGIEGNRMLARHNRHNRSLGRHPWKDGDVIGCFLDLLPPTTTTSTTVTSPEDIVACIGYTINGQPLRDLHDSTSNGTMFQIKRHVLGTSGGAGLSLVPVIQLEPSTILNVFTDACDLNFLPATFSPLGSGDYSRSALARWIQQPIRASATLPPTTTMSQLSSSQLEQFSQAISRMHDLSSYSHTTWSTRDVVSLHVASMQNAILNEAGTRASHNELETLIRWSLTIEGLLRDVGNLAAPWDNHLAGIPPSTNHTFTLPSAVTQLLQTVASPVVALDTLHLYMTSTNRSINEHVKLTLNRRKAHAIINPTVGGGDVTTADRLRGSLFGQLVSLVGKKPSTLFKTGKKLWSVSFAGEGADDVGGPYREALSEVSAELLNSSLALFVPSSNQTSGQGPYQDRFTVNPSLSSPLSLNLYTFLGRLMGGCLRSGEVLPLSLPPTFWIRLVNGSTNGLNSTTASLSFVDEHVAQSLLQIDGTYLDVDTPVVTDVTGKERLLYHSTSQASTIVTTHTTVSATASDAAALAYRALVAEFRVQVEGSDAWDAIAQGFYQVVPAFAIRSFKWHELEQSVCGQSDIDVEQLMSTVRLDGLKPTDRRIEFLKNILIQFTTHERALFLRFVTGRERQSFGLRLKLMPSTHHSSSSDELYDDAHLPHASTCFFWLSLPNYSSQEVMKSKLLFAINQCHDIDADFRVRNTDLEDDQGEDGQPTVAVREQDDEEEEFEDYHHLL